MGAVFVDSFLITRGKQGARLLVRVHACLIESSPIRFYELTQTFLLNMQGVLIERNLPAPGRHLCGLTWDGVHLWHSDGDTNLIYRIDPTSGKTLGSIPCPDVRTDLSYDSANLWQIAGHPKRIVVIDPGQAAILREVDLGSDRENACGLCVSGENYWVGFKQKGVIEECSLRDSMVLREYRTLGRADGVAFAMDNLWYTDYDRSLLVGIDVRTGKELERHVLPGKPTGLCWDGSRFWYSDYANKQIRAVHLKKKRYPSP